MMKYLLVLGFAIAFGAGLVIGLEQRITAQATPSASQPTTARSRGFLTSELKLTPAQQAEMKKIWDSFHEAGRKQNDARNLINREREESITALIRPEDKDKYSQIQKTYSEKREALSQKTQAAFQAAIANTMAILSPDQQKTYERIMKDHRGPDRGSRQHDTGRRGDDRAASRPGTDK